MDLAPEAPARGAQPGRELEDWVQAERDLSAE
jgi:hypothetical protein